jgi:hypothetical protein
MLKNAVISIISVNNQSGKPVNLSFPTNDSLVLTHLNSLKRGLKYILAAT